MPTYEYETVPAREGDPVRRYEFRQSMADEPMRVHPETGEKLRRVYSAFAVGGSSSSECGGCEGGECACESGGGHHHGSGCGCGCCH
jgi:predicted nucleic acid-binding Zn ribbon protein